MTGLSAVIGSWKIMAMREPRSWRSRSGGSLVRCAGTPSPFWKVISPVTMAAGGSKPMMASEVMDFPEPDSPTRPRTSPGAMENDRLLTTATGEATVATCVDENARPARDCGNSMVKSRTSSTGRTKSMLSAPGLLFWTRFRWHQSGNAVVHHQLPVVFSRVLEQAPPHIGNSHLLMGERI